MPRFGTLAAAGFRQNYAGNTFRLDGKTALRANTSAAAIKALTGTNTDGLYYINLPTVGVQQVYCIMNSGADGGGWMMAMKATTGNTFQFQTPYWTAVNTLNTTSIDRTDADAKFDTMNYYQAKDMMALWPDISTVGGGLGTGHPYNCWSWLYNNFCTTYTSRNAGPTGPRSTLINLFNTASYQFVQDAKTWNGWDPGVFSSQNDIRFYGINWQDNYSSRWGFGWNEHGGGLYPSGNTGSDDACGGIGMSLSTHDHPEPSAGDVFNCCGAAGINRSARVEIYVR